MKKIKTSQVAGETYITGGEAICDNEDLLHDILVRLPTKSLLQLRCISKRWNSLISSPQFRRRHCRLHAATSAATGLLLFRMFTSKYLMDHLVYFPTNNSSNNNYSRTIPCSIRRFHYPLAFSGFHLLHSCNGLFCVGFFCESNFLYVYNPCTSCYASISLPSKVRVYQFIRAINLAFDPSRSDFYRIICIYKSSLVNEDNPPLWKNVYKIFIYASESGKWKDTGKVLDDKEGYLLNRGVFWQGCIHWVGRFKDFLAFDVENETFRAMPSILAPRKICYFGDWGGGLHVIRGCPGRTSSLVDVMELKMDYSEWSFKYRVDIGDIGRGIGGNADGTEIDILCFVEANGEGKTMLIVSAQGRIFSYNIICRTFEEVCNVSKYASVEQDPLDYKYRWCQAFQHFETLACV